jgi:hypothetical protein
MVVIDIYSTCWCMKSVFYERQHKLGGFFANFVGFNGIWNYSSTGKSGESGP